MKKCYFLTLIIFLFCIPFTLNVFANTTQSKIDDPYFEEFKEVYTLHSMMSIQNLKGWPAFQVRIKEERRNNIFRTFQNINIEMLLTLDGNQRLALMVNLHNSILSYLTLTYAFQPNNSDIDLEILHPSIYEHDNTDMNDRLCGFFHFDDFFYTEVATGLGRLSMNDISRGILANDGVHLFTTREKDPEKEKRLMEIRGLIFEDDEPVDPRILFLLTCGSPICPTFGDIQRAAGISIPADITPVTGKLIADKKFLDNAIKQFLSRTIKIDFERENAESTTIIGSKDLPIIGISFGWGEVSDIDRIELPYYLKVYAGQILNVHEDWKYFLIEYLPENLRSESLLSNYDSEVIKKYLSKLPWLSRYYFVHEKSDFCLH